MDPSRAIHTFLDRVAGRLRRRAAWVGSLYLVAFLSALALLAPLSADWAGLNVRGAWVLASLALVATLGGWYAAFRIPKNRWSKPEASARYIGGRVAPIRSDLISSVELMNSGDSMGSAELRQALFEQTARRLEPLRLQSLVPFTKIKRPLGVAALMLSLQLATLLFAPSALAQGWARLMSAPERAPFGGASMVEEPLVGDVDILINFPDYTRKPSLKLPASSGDFEAMPGSTIEIATRALGRVSAARILLARSAELESDEELEMSLDEGHLHARFAVEKETYYRFSIQSGDSRRVEARARHIAMHSDRSPRVELYAPADELDVAKINRIELAYVASDDFGIAKVELVYKPEGGEEQRVPLDVPTLEPEGGQPRSAQFKYVWDLAELPLRPGAQISYHLEVTDNDNVLGPNLGRSKSYKLKLFSPRERHADLIDRQRELAEHMLDLLGARLTSDPSDLSGHRSVHRMAGDIIVEIGSLVAALKSDELATPKLQASIANIRDRMNQRNRSEAALLSELQQRPPMPPAEDTLLRKKLGDSDEVIIAELEDDVLSLSDWLNRQQVEYSLSISDEIKASQERIDKLFAEYERTGSKELLAEIERELRALERRIQEKASSNASVPEDVLDRFVNSDALKQDEESGCLAKVRTMLDAGDVIAAREQMARCASDMDSSAEKLEEALKALRGESFTEEEKAFQELMDSMADLSQDQEDVADRADEIYERYAEAASKLKNDKLSEAKKSAGDTIAKLRKKLRQVPRAGLSPFAKEEFDLLKKRLDDTEEMLERGELAEALSMARHANRSLETVQDELEFSLDEAWTRETFAAEKAARSALPLSRRLVDELEKATPSPADIMDKDDRAKLEQLRRKQKSIRKRAEKLQKQVEGQAEQLPGDSAGAVQEGLQKAMKHMDQAEQQMRAKDPSSARQEAREAAKRLGQAQDSARGAARQKQAQGRSLRDEPIRIPGAEDYKAPAQFREEILDAMKDESAPSGFAEQVKRYYKDIIQ